MICVIFSDFCYHLGILESKNKNGIYCIGGNKSASKTRLGKVLLLMPCLFFLAQVCKYFCILPSPVI
ncbi:hypothetical protein Nmel_000249 [Mimus melanotis]